MRKYFIALLVLTQFFLSGFAFVDDTYYGSGEKIASQKIGEYLVSVFSTYESECIGYLESIKYIESEKDSTLTDIENGKIYHRKPICELDGRYTATGYSEIHIMDAKFNNNSIHLLISFTYLRHVGEFRRECVINVTNGTFSELICGQRKKVEE